MMGMGCRVGMGQHYGDKDKIVYRVILYKKSNYFIITPEWRWAF